jgi:hypothetical protein
MRFHRRRFMGLCGGAIAGLAGSSFARAQDYPARPVTIAGRGGGRRDWGP